MKASNKSSYDKNAAIWEEYYSINSYTHAYIEKPAALKSMGDIKGKNLVCIGCGSGEEANLFYEKGAKVVGFDFSSKLIKIAKKKYPLVEFHVGDAENFGIPKKFDLAYAGFVAHYFESWELFLNNSANLLEEGGEFLLSVVHPVKRSLRKIKTEDNKMTLLGYSRDFKEEAKKKEYRVYGDYHTPQTIEIEFAEGFRVTNYHQTISQQIKEILSSPFELVDMLEPLPITEAENEYPHKYARDLKIPQVLIYKLRKK